MTFVVRVERNVQDVAARRRVWNRRPVAVESHHIIRVECDLDLLVGLFKRSLVNSECESRPGHGSEQVHCDNDGVPHFACLVHAIPKRIAQFGLKAFVLVKREHALTGQRCEEMSVVRV